MSTVVAKVYGAFLSAGAPEDKARAAAQAVAAYNSGFSGLNVRMGRVEASLRLLQWMTGTNVAVTGAVLLKLLVR